MCEWRLSHLRSGVVVVWEGRWGCWVLDCLGWAGAAMCEWRLSHCVPDGVLFGHFGLLPCRIFAMCEWRLSHRRLAGAFSGVWGCFRAGSSLCVSGGCHIGGLGGLLCGRVVGVAGFWIALVGPGLLCVSGGCHIGGWQGHFQGFGVVFVLDSSLCVSGGCHIGGLWRRFRGFGAVFGLNPCYVRVVAITLAVWGGCCVGGSLGLLGFGLPWLGRGCYV